MRTLKPGESHHLPSGLVVVQYETEHVMGPWDGRRQELARYARKVRKPGFYTVPDEEPEPEPQAHPQPEFRMDAAAKEAMKRQWAADEDWMYSQDNPRRVGP